ncbi:WW domain binding protein 11-domain-containing protein [Lactarius hengduanensis]|nr:WW domain binding protein 11-domain-containing protein [Lactarius hengduanensis]
MAKGKNLNPADAFRKAQRKKELKKNKTGRQKTRDFALVKKDTWDLEDEIDKLSSAASLPDADQKRLKDLKVELDNITKKKEKYLEEHPDQRKLVFRPRRQPKDGQPSKGGPAEEEEEGTDDDIPMPEAPPPGASKEEEEEDTDDDIPMPEGPPPGSAPSLPPHLPLPVPPPPPGFPPNVGGVPPPPPGFPNVPFIPPLPGFPAPPPPPPPGFPGGSPAGHFPPPPLGFPPPPPGFGPPPGGFTPAPVGLFNNLPPPPPGFFPRRGPAPVAQSSGSRAPVHAAPSLPHKPSAAVTASATVSAEAQLRDFKKESTAFVPTSLKRKRAAAGGGAGKVNAAPTVDGEKDGQAQGAAQVRPDIVSTLKAQFGDAPEVKAEGKPKVKGDYEKFVEGMGDILGSR